jgi:alpha-amylase
VYYGQEQGFSGLADPVRLFGYVDFTHHSPRLQYNREPLWPSNYAKTDKYNMITTLNTVRYLLSGRALVDYISA